jgi:hypothetical protein
MTRFAAACDALSEIADVEEVSPDCSGAIEAFRTLRAAHIADGYGALLRDRRAELTPTVIWNIEAGARLIVRVAVASTVSKLLHETGRCIAQAQRYVESAELLHVGACFAEGPAGSILLIAEIIGLGWRVQRVALRCRRPANQSRAAPR